MSTATAVPLSSSGDASAICAELICWKVVVSSTSGTHSAKSSGGVEIRAKRAKQITRPAAEASESVRSEKRRLRADTATACVIMPAASIERGESAVRGEKWGACRPAAGVTAREGRACEQTNKQPRSHAQTGENRLPAAESQPNGSQRFGQGKHSHR